MKELDRIHDCVVQMDEEGIILAIDQAIDKGITTEDIFLKGLSKGMSRVTELYEERKYYIPEVIVCADTLKKGIKHLKDKGGVQSNNGIKVLLAVVEGDHHEIGKNIVKIMLEAANFQVIDLGLNVKTKEIISQALTEQVDIIGLSTMMTTTMGAMATVVNELKKLNPSHYKIPKVVIGGGCINQNFADQIGCDGYAKNAMEGVKMMRKLAGGDDN